MGYIFNITPVSVASLTIDLSPPRYRGMTPYYFIKARIASYLSGDSKPGEASDTEESGHLREHFRRDAVVIHQPHGSRQAECNAAHPEDAAESSRSLRRQPANTLHTEHRGRQAREVGELGVAQGFSCGESGQSRRHRDTDRHLCDRNITGKKGRNVRFSCDAWQGRGWVPKSDFGFVSLGIELSAKDAILEMGVKETRTYLVELLRVTRALEQVQHLLRDTKPTDDVHGRHEESRSAQELRRGFRQKASSWKYHPADGGHTRDGIRHGHERGVQGWRDAVHQLVARQTCLAPQKQADSSTTVVTLALISAH